MQTLEKPLLEFPARTMDWGQIEASLMRGLSLTHVDQVLPVISSFLEAFLKPFPLDALASGRADFTVAQYRWGSYEACVARLSRYADALEHAVKDESQAARDKAKEIGDTLRAEAKHGVPDIAKLLGPDPDFLHAVMSGELAKLGECLRNAGLGLNESDVRWTVEHFSRCSFSSLVAFCTDRRYLTAGPEAKRVTEPLLARIKAVGDVLGKASAALESELLPLVENPRARHTVGFDVRMYGRDADGMAYTLSKLE